MKLDPNVGLDPRVCVVNLLSVIITTGLYKWESNIALIKSSKTAKFWTFTKFDKTWPKRWYRPKNLCGKFGKRNNNYKFV